MCVNQKKAPGQIRMNKQIRQMPYTAARKNLHSVTLLAGKGDDQPQKEKEKP